MPQSIDDAALLAALAKKLAPPLVTLLGSEPEIQVRGGRQPMLCSFHDQTISLEVIVFNEYRLSIVNTVGRVSEPEIQVQGGGGGLGSGLDPFIFTFQGTTQ